MHLLKMLMIMAGLLLLHSCGTKKVSLWVGGAPDEIAYWQQIVQYYNDSTGSAVELVQQPTDTDARRQGITTALAAGQPDPDVFVMDVAWLSQMIESKWLLWLDPLRADTSDFYSSILAAADIVRDTLWALPLYVDAGVLYYRTDLLEELGKTTPPQTWEQLIELSIDLQKVHPEIWGYVFQGAQYEGLVCNFLEVAESAGGGIAIEQKPHIASEENIKALALLRSFIDSLQISPPNTYTDMQEEQVRQLFQSGKALFERNWPYAWSLHTRAGAVTQGKTGIAPLPHFAGHNSAATLGGWHVGISRYTDMPQQARDLLFYLISKEVQTQLALNLGWNPGRKSVYSDSAVIAAMPHLQKLSPVFKNAVARPMVPYYSSLSSVLQVHLNAALSGRVKPREALRAAEEEIASIIERYAD